MVIVTENFKVTESFKCFIITPIGQDRTEIRDSLEGLMLNVLTPVLKELGSAEDNIFVAHKMHESGSINNQIIQHIIEDELCIVNLTGLNPNVMYELAVRHAVGKPVIIIAEDGTKLPFDIGDQRTIFYKDSMLGAVELKDNLKNMIVATLKNAENIDNPVIKLIKENSVLSQIQNTTIDADTVKLLLEKMFDLEDSVKNMKNNMNKEKKNSFITRGFKYEYFIDLINPEFADNSDATNFASSLHRFITDNINGEFAIRKNEIGDIFINVNSVLSDRDQELIKNYLINKGYKFNGLIRIK